MDNDAPPCARPDGSACGSSLVRIGAARRSACNVRPHKMRNAVLAAMIASTILGQVASHAQVMTTSIPQQTEEERVLGAEDEYIAAEVTRDEAALRRLVDDRFAFNSSKGTTIGKEDFIQSVLKLAMVGQTVRERSVLIEGDVALILERRSCDSRIPATKNRYRAFAIRPPT